METTRPGDATRGPRRVVEVVPVDELADDGDPDGWQVDLAERRRHSAMVERLDADVRTMLDTGDWTTATPGHFAVAYGVYHERVYGLAAEELWDPATWRRVERAAATLLRDSFAADVEAMADFCWWSWERARQRDAWCRATGKVARRLEWREAFAVESVSRYKFAMMREPEGDADKIASGGR